VELLAAQSSEAEHPQKKAFNNKRENAINAASNALSTFPQHFNVPSFRTPQE
jgi:hypothetical protein